MAKKNARTVVKKKKVNVESYGRVFIQATFNNIIVSITNSTGQVIAWSSAGKMGFKGSKKNTPYAGLTAANECGKIAYDLGMRKADVQIKGPGAGREAAIRTISNLGIEIVTIHDVTPIPHNGCRPPKKRRV
ncbi:MAG: 30S ribosomal protein S11 [Flavobacterium sp.]|nr:MAG: 30S ribosomal protein S11 [Flavobacterium sp.]